jgi:hypothetical protein
VIRIILADLILKKFEVMPTLGFFGFHLLPILTGELPKIM